MDSGSVSPLAAAVQALRLLVAVPAASDSRKDLAKQELLRRIELLLQEQQLQQQEQQQHQAHQQWHREVHWDRQHTWPTHKEHVQQQQDQQLQEQQQGPQEWAQQWESEATTQTEVLEQLEDSLLLLCCQHPPSALQQQLLRVLLLLVQSTEDCGVWHRVASRLLAAAGEGLHLPHSVYTPIVAAAAPPPTAAAAAAADAAAAGTGKVLSPLPPLLLCGELFKACPQALSPLLPHLVAVGSKLLRSPAAHATATAATTTATVAKALRTAVAATGACGEALAGKLFSLALACLRWKTTSRSSSSRSSSSKASCSIKGGSRYAAAEATREALLLLQQVVWAFPRGVSPPHDDALFSAVLSAAAPESAAAAAATENEDMLEAAQENVPHAAAALAALLAAKAVAGVHQQQQVKQQQQAQQHKHQQQASLSVSDEPVDPSAKSSKVADFVSLSLAQCMTAAAATADAAASATKGVYSEVRSVEDAFTLLRRQWLLLHARVAADAKRGLAGSATSARYTPALQPQQQGPLLLHVKARRQGLLRQAIAAAVPCLCRFLLRCLPPVSLVNISLESMFTLLAQLTAAESCCNCSKRGGASKGLQEKRLRACSCCCSCSGGLPPSACCLSLETLHSQALVAHAAQQLLPLLEPEQQLGLVDCLSRAIAAAATGATAPREPSETRGPVGCSSSGGSFTHPLLLLAALNILEAVVVSAGQAGVVAFPPSLHKTFVAILTVQNPLQHAQQQQQLRCVFWPAVQRQAAACLWRVRCLSRCPSAVHAMALELTQSATALAEAALQTTNMAGGGLDTHQFAGLWGACLGLTASITPAFPTPAQQPATTATAAAEPAVTAATTAAAKGAATAAHSKEGDLGSITALLSLLARGGGPETRVCFFLLAEALLKMPAEALLKVPAIAPVAFATAATAAAGAVDNEDTEQATLLSPIVCCFLRSSRKALSLTDSKSTINRLLHIAAAASEAARGTTVMQHTAETAVAAAADTWPGAATDMRAADTETAAAGRATAKCLLLELTCAFKAVAAFVRQQLETTAATTHDTDTASDLVTLVIKAAFIMCCCRCSSNSINELSLHSMITYEEGSPETTQQKQQHYQQQQVCCRCFFRGSASPVSTAYAGLEAAALEALSLLPHTQNHCGNKQQQQLMLQIALEALTVPARAVSLFPAAAVACCISPIAIAPAAALRAAPLEQLQQQQILVQRLLLQQQQQGTVNSALFIGCGTAVDSLRGPTLWEAQWRCTVDVTTAAFNALRLPIVAAPAEAAVGVAGTGWRADYPPHVIRVLQGALLLRRLFLSCSVCSPSAAEAMQQTAWTACCSWGWQLPPAVSSDAPAARPSLRSSKIEASETGVACDTTGVHHRAFGGLMASRPQLLLQRFGLPRLKKKSFRDVPAASLAAEACCAAGHDPSDFASECNHDSALQMSIVAAVLSGVFRERQALLSSPTQQQQQPQQQVSSSVVDTLWCCCEKALATAAPLERLLYADVAGGLYSILRIADSTQQQQQQQDTATTTGLQAVNKHIEAFLHMPLNGEETRGQEAPLLISSSRVCSVSLLAARLLPLLHHSGSSAAAAADASSKCCEDLLLQMALATTSSIETAEDAAAAAGVAATASTKDNAAATIVCSSCALLCVVRFLGSAFPAVALGAAAATSLTRGSTRSAGAGAEMRAGSTYPGNQRQLQQQQENVMQQQLFRALQFTLLLRSSQSHFSRAALLAADAARHLLECLLQHAAAAAAAGPGALFSATEDCISYAAREAAYLLSVSLQSAADSSSSSSEIVLQLVAAAPALRCLTALVWIQSSASAARTEATSAEGEDSTLAAVAVSLRALLPAAVAATEFAIASPSLVVRREAARSLLSMSRPLKETVWGPTIATAAAAAPPEVATAAASPVAGDPQLALFLLEALNSERDVLQRQLLLQVLQQQVRIWGPKNLKQWISLLTALCSSSCTPTSSPSAHQLSALRPSSSGHGPNAAVLLHRAQQLVPQTPKVLLSPLAAARPLPALTGFVWRPLPGVSAASATQTQDECSAGTINSSNDNECSGAEVQPIVRLAAAECLEFLLTLPELQRRQPFWSAIVADEYQAEHAEDDTPAPTGSLLIECLPMLARAACELLWQGIQQQQQQQQSGLASDGGISLARWGLRILLLLLQRLTGVSSARIGPQGLPVQQLQQYEVGVSSAVSDLLRCYAKSSTPTLLDMPETVAVVAAAVAAALTAAEGEVAVALHRAALLRLRAASAGGDAIHDEDSKLLDPQGQPQEPQQEQLIAMALDVMLRFTEAGCCLSPWRLVGQLLLPLGDVEQSAAVFVAEALTATPQTASSDCLLQHRLLLACQLVGHVAAAATHAADAQHAIPTVSTSVFAEQHEQWVAAIEPCAVPLVLHLMARLLKLHRQRQQQGEQQNQQQQQQDELKLLKGLVLLCRPLSTGRGGRETAAASAAFTALAVASRSSIARGTAAAPGASATAAATSTGLSEAYCSLLNVLADALLQPLEAAVAVWESCPAGADWSEADADGVCWRLELIRSLLLSLCFPLDPQQKKQQLPQQQQQHHQLDEEDWADNWHGADGPATSSGVPASAATPAGTSSFEVLAKGSLAAALLYPGVLRRACEAARRLSVAAAEAGAAPRAGLDEQDHSGAAGAGAAGLPQQGRGPFDGVEDTKAATAAALSTVELADAPTAGGSAARIVCSCINLLWSVSAALQHNPAVLTKEATALAFFAAVKDVTTAALWMHVDAVPPEAAAAEEDRPDTLCEVALSLLKRGFCVVAVMPSAVAAASAVPLLLSPLEAPAFPSRLCNGAANSVSPLDAMRLLRNLYEAAAVAVGATATAETTETTKDTAVIAHAVSTSLQEHCACLIDSAVSSFTGTTAALEGKPPTAAVAAAAAVSSSAAGDTGGVLALAAALVAVDALAVTNGPWNSSDLNGQEQQRQEHQQQEWYARIRTALQRLSEFAYAVDGDGGHGSPAAAAVMTVESDAASGTPDGATTAKEWPPTVAGTKPTAWGSTAANERGDGAADAAALLEEAEGTAAATSSAQEVTEAEATGFLLPWPAARQHAAAQLRGFLLRVARVFNQSATAAPSSFPCLLAAAAVSCLIPALSPHLSSPPSSSKNGKSSHRGWNQLFTTEEHQTHPVKTLEAFLMELSPQNKAVPEGCDLLPFSEALIAALGSVIAGVLALQSRAEVAGREGESAKATALRTAAATEATAKNSGEELSESEAFSAEVDAAAAAASEEAATEAAATMLGSSAPAPQSVEAAVQRAEPTAAPPQSRSLEETATSPEPEAQDTASDSAAPQSAASDSASASSSPDVPTRDPAEAATPRESAGAVEPAATGARAPSSTPAEAAGKPNLCETRGAAYLAAAASLLYLAVSRHPAVAAKAIEAAAAAAHAEAAAEMTEAAALACRTQQVKAVVARLLQEELKRKQHGGS